jgi:UDP-4-amino-4-deoxy-L-arabinose formyltransferase/UDP-glucuronic acid dehydrogenase (UDP-4-keto-hexauronic acid decarboxylating)
MEALLEIGAPITGLFTHRDSPDEEIWWQSCAELARRYRIPVFTPDKLDAEAQEQVRRCAPAVIYSAYYRSLIPSGILALASHGAYNLHGSLLPNYRGRAPVNWMLVNGEREGGVTLHHMIARADAGDIVAQRAIVIDDSDNALTLYSRLVPLWNALIREYHPLIVAGTAPRRPQDLRQGSYYGRRGPEDGRIDWRWPARRIFNLVRAVTHPYPGAFGFAGEEKLLVWEARSLDADGGREEPGTIVACRADGTVEVAAGTGRLLLQRVQFINQVEDTAAKVLAEFAQGKDRRLQ